MSARTTGAEVAKRVARLGATKSDTTRRKLELELAKLPKKGLVDAVNLAFASLPQARWALPSLLGTLAEKRIPGAKEALGPLFADKDETVRDNAVDVVEAMDWGDDFTKLLAELASKEASKSKPSAALIPALGALGKARSEAAWKALLALAKRGVKNPWRKGNLFLAIARQQRPEARALLEATAKRPKEHAYVRQTAHAGLARLGVRSALEALRRDLDSADVMHARSAAQNLAEILGTKPAVTPAELQRLARWYDGKPAELNARYARFCRAASRAGQGRPKTGRTRSVKPG